VTDAEKQAGLMWRTSLDDGRGMLFVYSRDELMNFWRKNTLIDLSIGYIASDGRILVIKDMYKGSLQPVSSDRAVRYALEVPTGWFERSHITTGDVLLAADGGSLP
jgi:uncharacterized membrane protein (UPF0127 family)